MASRGAAAQVDKPFQLCCEDPGKDLGTQRDVNVPPHVRERETCTNNDDLDVDPQVQYGDISGDAGAINDATVGVHSPHSASADIQGDYFVATSGYTGDNDRIHLP